MKKGKKKRNLHIPRKRKKGMGGGNQILKKKKKKKPSNDAHPAEYCNSWIDNNNALAAAAATDFSPGEACAA